MKNTMKKILLTMFSVLILSVLFCFSASALRDGNYVYTVTDGKATITDVSLKLSGDVKIPSKLGGYTVEGIQSDAFFGCKNITKITFPKSIECIEQNCFNECTKLKSIAFLGTPDYIDAYAFQGTPWYDNQKNGIIYAGKTAIGYKGNKEKVTSLKFKDGTIRISDYSFTGFTNLEEIYFPNSLRYIGEDAFSDSKFYENLPDGLVYIGKILYKYKGTAEENTKIEIKEGTEYIGTGAFVLQENITEITLPDSVKYIGSGAFSCTAIKTITLPKNLEVIEDTVFSDCSNLKAITIPDSVKSIGVSAFGGCVNLSTVEFGNNLRLINSNAFEGCIKLTKITLPKKLENIGSAAFYGCKKLKTISVPSSVYDIDADSFKDTLWLKAKKSGVVYAGKVALLYKGKMKKNAEISLKKGTKGISAYAFSKQNKLKKITIPSTVKFIGAGAFDNCTNLRSVTIPKSVTDIKNFTFNNCKKLATVKLPDTLTNIGNRAFSFCSKLKEIKIPNGVSEIPYYAFLNCENLSKVTLPKNLLAIGWGAFSGCTKLTEVSLPNGIEEIGDSAFSGCTKLKSVYIPKSTEFISYSFFGCEKLKNVYYGGTKKKWKNLFPYGQDEYLANAKIHYSAKKIG